MDHCNGCGAVFSICHTLDCKKGGLITARHNKLPDEVADLAGKYFTPMHVHYDPKIFTGRTVRRGKDKTKRKAAPPKDEGGVKWDILMIDLWKQGTDSINDMRFVNTDVISYQTQTPEKCLETAEREKKKKYLNTYINKRRQFTTFVASVDGLLRINAEATLKCTNSQLATKGKDPYSRTCGYMKSRVAINLVSATHLCIRGERVPASQISVTRPQWEESSGLHLFW